MVYTSYSRLQTIEGSESIATPRDVLFEKGVGAIRGAFVVPLDDFDILEGIVPWRLPGAFQMSARGKTLGDSKQGPLVFTRPNMGHVAPIILPILLVWSVG